MTDTKKIDALKNASSRNDLAKLLNVNVIFLTNILYKVGTDNQYKQFSIPKRGTGIRVISAPNDKLKDLQRRIANLLIDCRQELFNSKKIKNNFSFGFEKDKSIISNASRHKGKRIILNLDLRDFFGSFNFGRVRGYFISNRDFKLTPVVATTLAQAACYKGVLPQGSPCSPVITNFICNIMDMRLAKLAKELGCTYTRYADDITFSTNKKIFPEELAIPELEGVILGSRLVNEITKAGFKVNDAKTRLAYKSSRQEVTGLTVNQIVNVDRRYAKKVRALAQTLYSTGKYKLPDKNGNMILGNLARLEGMFSFINFIDKSNNIENKKNKQPEKYVKVQEKLNGYRLRLNAREKAYSKFIYYKYFHGNTIPTILTEGKTDRIYLTTALHSLSAIYPNLIEETNNGKKIKLNICKSNTKASYFLDLSGGTANLKKFVMRYRDEYELYYGTDAKNPVIIILDNDSGPNKLLDHLKNKVENCPNDVKSMRRMKYIHVTHNLYIVLTPLSESVRETSMEDLFSPEVLNITLNGKYFNKANDQDTETEYSKHIFSTKVVRDKNRNIDFKGFKPIFDAIEAIINHYQELSKSRIINKAR
ncbi:retron Ec67 family RNA-directed DNA polymerase/endonuclease [Arsenophonus apicola]|jgi:RNA-directed DNA polymerase|uniref:retron Ec67 family RNA-directed DNA polymerase/endonuclease n=1 Tax=Arsenophonus apicola TaxID=2879119 RepID=UPI0038791EAA